MPTPASSATAPLVVAMGDPAGVGPEIVAKAWSARDERGLPPFVAVGDPRAVALVWNGPVAPVRDLHEALAVFDRALPILPVSGGGEITPGVPDTEGARGALASLETAAGVAQSGAARALVTGPVSKAQLYSIGFTHPGQTEFVAERCGVSADNAVMLLAGPSLRVVPITTHIALAQVPGALSIELVLVKARAVVRGLRKNFGIARPRLAFAGLNPHAGEGGALGREEIEILEPAIAILQAEGVDAVGPLAADTMFHPRARERYDVAICCYHDQALVPLKTIHFDEGVNFTLGLPIVRTSPDHGTAFAIAGRDAAHPGAMIAAIVMAHQAAERRFATVSTT